MLLEPGRALGKYRIERQLGSGGMGVVFLAYDTTLERRVAIKVLESAGELARGSADPGPLLTALDVLLARRRRRTGC